MYLAIGSVIRWQSGAGVMRGTITNITLSLSTDEQMVPWIDVALNQNTVVSLYFIGPAVRLCGTDSELKIMDVQVVA